MGKCSALGNFRLHCKKAQEGNFSQRVVHIFIAAIQLPPLLGQIAATFEKILVTHFNNSPLEIFPQKIQLLRLDLILCAICALCGLIFG